MDIQTKLILDNARQALACAGVMFCAFVFSAAAMIMMAAAIVDTLGW